MCKKNPVLSANNTNKEERKINHIITLFQSFIQNHSCFDILYSPKVGYLLVPVPSYDEIETLSIQRAEQMLDILFNELICDVVYAPENGDHMDNHITEQEADEVFRRLAAILKDAPEDERNLYIALMKECIRHDPLNPTMSDDEE